MANENNEEKIEFWNILPLFQNICRMHIIVYTIVFRIFERYCN